ncbi:MAG: nucleotidyltransferase domain-containing protein [Actinomycetota bacterium]
MAKASTQTLNIVNTFLEEVAKEISIKRVIMFGSQVSGKANKWSDIDLAIISDDFKDMSNFERLVFLGKIAWRAKTTAIEALGFTEEEYQHVSPLDFLSEIKSKGKVIYGK